MLKASLPRLLASLSALGVLLLAAAPAYANDPGDFVDCSNRPNSAGCKVTVGTPGRPGAGDQGDNADADTGGGGGDDSTCRWVKPADRPAPPGADPSNGGWYMKVCGSGNRSLGTAPQWIADQPEAADPAVLARQASADLELPSPRIRANPDPAVDVLVRVPVWLWVDGATWGTRSATASVPGVSVTATARPVVVRWEMGDGTTVTCRGSGTAWKPGMNPKASSPDCGHVYRLSSAAAPGARFAVRATVTWSVSWAGGGTSGTLPALTTTDAVSVRVAESQAINGGVLG